MDERITTTGVVVCRGNWAYPHVSGSLHDSRSPKPGVTMFRLRAFASSVLLTMAAPAAFAATCEVTVESTDQMSFNTKAIEVSEQCKTFTVKLDHVGSLSMEVMGHNWVLTTKADERNVAMDGMMAGRKNGYVKPNDPRVIAATQLIGGGEATSVSFDVSKLSKDEDYLFFCSFPGHVAMMRGTLKVVD
jgi:azurin